MKAELSSTNTSMGTSLMKIRTILDRVDLGSMALPESRRGDVRDRDQVRGPMQSLEEFSLPIIEEGPTLANPAVFPNTVYNAAGGQTAIKLGALGVASTVTAQHAAGAQALTYAYDLTSVNQAEVVLAIASKPAAPNS
jgi:hypothetical protein